MHSFHQDRLTWQHAAGAFDRHAAEYDRWFDDSPLFRIELAALVRLGGNLPRPFLEIGVGPGRFARALGIDFGIDPAISPLKLARRRNIQVARAIGEQLPVRSACTGTVFILFTLGFLADPAAALRECARIIRPGGRLVIGMLPRLSPWGLLTAAKKKENNVFYRHARLRSIAEVDTMLSGSGFTIIESWSTLFQPPGASLAQETPRQGHDENAGFCVLVMEKKEAADATAQPDHPDH